MTRSARVWQSTLGGSVAWLTAVPLTGCTLGDWEYDDEPGGDARVPIAIETSLVSQVEPIRTTKPVVTPDAKATGTPSAVNPNRTAGLCPERMVEVKGNYCTGLMHRCIKGGRNHLGEDTPEPLPFYCDKYERGYAKCLGKEEPKHFCIDEYEFPNEVGVIPIVMVSWHEASQLCGVQGKRLCGDDEWTLACEGPKRLPYPYGWERDATACNIDHLWMKPNDGLLLTATSDPEAIQAEVKRLSKRVPSGSMPGCTSPYGAMDMGGNVDEWAVNVTLHGKPYQSVFKGGHWVSGARNRCRPVTASHDETTAYYAEGFRCCADVVTSSKL